MLYRRFSPQPPRLLLRIVATAGASALLGAAACSSDGSIANMPNSDEAGTPGPCGGGPCGSVAMPPAPPPGDSSDGNPMGGHNPCGTGGMVCGSVAFPTPGDASEASWVGGGTMIAPDSGTDARGPCGGGPCGVIAMPHDAGDECCGIIPDSGGGPCNGGPCGLIIMPEAGSD